VLIVDDDTDVCATLWDLLQERGHRTCVAHDVASALARISEARYAAIVLDMKLPDGDGSEVFRSARLGSPSSRIIVITGYESEMGGQLARMSSEGAFALLHKPIEPAMLLTILRNPGESC
jgi:two-component system response regulator PilR (NtrC family)